MNVNELSAQEIDAMTDRDHRLGIDADGLTHYYAAGNIAWVVDDGDLVGAQDIPSASEYVDHVRAAVGWDTVYYSGERLDEFLANVVEKASGSEVSA